MYLRHYIIRIWLIISTVFKFVILHFNKRKDDILIDISIMRDFEYNNINFSGTIIN